MHNLGYDHERSWEENLSRHGMIHEGEAQRVGDKLNKLRERPALSPQLDELRNSDVSKLVEEQQRHLEHASFAAQGYVLDDDDSSWQLRHQALRAEAGKRGRLLHPDRTSDHDDQQPGNPLRVKM